MKTIIKYRAWYKYKKEMHRVSEILLLTEPYMHLRLVGESPITSFRVGDNVELMQFTGIKDRKSVEIYEGDIIYAKDYWGENGVVYWNDQQLQWWIKRLSNRADEPLRTPFADGHFAFEIIGNIYENPELLEAKQ